MENAEELLQLLEEFSKIKPKDIPRELEDYIGYVAKAGDPVFQWSLVKYLFREKLLSVITDFYESTLTVELPPCPNVEPFNYERMKTSLLERFDTFSSAPFTIQRICELLSNPRKEYNRADKYMRAIEKNILVVSTREPGTGKRPLENDSQSETVLNGIPDMKLNEPDPGILVHATADLPFLGAPPASNDVTVETTELSTSTNDRPRSVQEINGETAVSNLDSNESQLNQESGSIITKNINESTLQSDLTCSSIPSNTDEKSPKDSDCGVNTPITVVEDSETQINVGLTESLQGECSSNAFPRTYDTVLPDSIDSSDPCEDEQNHKEAVTTLDIEEGDERIASDENEVSSTPSGIVGESSVLEEKVDEPSDSEAEATDASLLQDEKTNLKSPDDNEINSSNTITQTNESKLISSEEANDKNITNKLDLECNEIAGTFDSPTFSENNSSLEIDTSKHSPNVDFEVSEHPDSSNDICLQNEISEIGKSETFTSEADSISERSPGTPSIQTEEVIEDTDCHTGRENESSQQSTCTEKDSIVLSSQSVLLSPNTSKDSKGRNEDSNFTSVEETSTYHRSHEKSASMNEDRNLVQDSEKMCDQDKREDSVIQTVSNNIPDSQQHVTVEEISVDPTCEAEEEEAMDVDDSSNQMMVSEGENDSEPMDQSDQLHS